MGNGLSNIWLNKALKDPKLFSSVSQGGTVPLRNQQLPNSGGTYSAEGTKPAGTPIFNPPPPPPPAEDLYAKYRDPKTGEIMSPEEYSAYLGNKVPKGSIAQYAGDALSKPDQSTADLTKTARSLSNQRNDIATGTTDPYNVGAKSGIAYNPRELAAIEKAYAGVYDPAINDVFAKLEEKKAEDERAQKKEEIVFRTNEAIRQWRATTGTTKTGSGGGHKFTPTQIAEGASNSGYTLAAFEALDSDDVKNFYINPLMVLDAMENKVPMYKNFQEDIQRVANGEISGSDLAAAIKGSNIPEDVKAHFILQIPDIPEPEKDGWLKKIYTITKAVRDIL